MNRRRLSTGGSEAEPPSIMNIQPRSSRTQRKYCAGSCHPYDFPRIQSFMPTGMSGLIHAGGFSR